MEIAASGRSLRVIAALVWYAGGIFLLLKGCGLLMEAGSTRPEKSWPWVALVAGILLGGMKAKYLFSKSCQKNIDRIATLHRPKIWQFFSPGFYLALAVMILAGTTITRVAYDNYPLLIVVAILDIGIGIALLGSSHVFWRQKTFVG